VLLSDDVGSGATVAVGRVSVATAVAVGASVAVVGSVSVVSPRATASPSATHPQIPSSSEASVVVSTAPVLVVPGSVDVVPLAGP